MQCHTSLLHTIYCKLQRSNDVEILIGGKPENIPNFPLQTIEVLEEFENTLGNDSQLHVYMVQRFSSLGGLSEENLSGLIMRHLIRNELAQNYNWMGHNRQGTKEIVFFANIFYNDVYHGEQRCSTWRKCGAEAAEDNCPGVEDDDGLYGAAVKGEPGAKGKHRRYCSRGKGFSGLCQRWTIADLSLTYISSSPTPDSGSEKPNLKTPIPNSVPIKPPPLHPYYVPTPKAILLKVESI
ncbi:hypothetical protein FQA39_LY00777 [Lamprigera yunnana]|nr:hypothetical protein FQA39_LY00777 [Lamprigera yunnana]